MLLGDPRQLTSERKASTSPSSFINRSTLLLERSSAKLLVHALEHSTGASAQRTRRRVGSARRRGNHMHDHSRFQRDIDDVTGVSLSLSLSLPLTKVTDAQYRKRFRASYNIKKSFEKLKKRETCSYLSLI